MNQPQDLYQEVRAGADIKSFLLSLHRRNTGELPVIDTEKVEAVERPDLLPTIVVPAISKLIPAAPHWLYLDEYGRQCLKLSSLLAETVDLVSEAVLAYRSATGYYPDEIIPCPSRYILLQYSHFCPVHGILVPFVRDFAFPIDYDVIVRGVRRG